MTGRRVPEELLQLEVRELTDLLRHDGGFAGLRDMLAAKGVPASAAILAGLIEGEDLSSYGVVLTPGRECVVFETAPGPGDSLVRWEVIDQPETLSDAFEAVLVGIAMVRDGRIS
jgi:hypothetical protein